MVNPTRPKTGRGGWVAKQTEWGKKGLPIVAPTQKRDQHVSSVLALARPGRAFLRDADVNNATRATLEADRSIGA